MKTLQTQISEAIAENPDRKARWKAMKLIKWRMYCPQLNLWAGLDGIDIVPCTSPDDPRVQVFDGRDNEDLKLPFYTAVTGIKWEVELCASLTLAHKRVAASRADARQNVPGRCELTGAKHGKIKPMSQFIELPNGDSIHKDTIKAIRLGDPRPGGCREWETEFKARVIVDFMVGDHGNCVVLGCASIEERDELAAKLKEQIK